MHPQSISNWNFDSFNAILLLGDPITPGKRCRLHGSIFANRSGSDMRLKVLLHPAEEGGFWVEVPALPGCVSEGESREEALSNIREAAEGWLEVSAEQAESDPLAQVVEVDL
ncbi:MAG: type II toxin-antitoxin system HicB family antitoxin [Pirellulales bacterium]